MHIDGACHCGFVTFEAEIDPEAVSVCHCTDCQTLSGAPMRASVAAPADTFRITSGKPAEYVKVAESGNKRVQAFCPRCGAPLYATGFDDPDAPRNIRVGVIAQRDELEPRRQVWTSSRQAWVGTLASIPGAERQ